MEAAYLERMLFRCALLSLALAYAPLSGASLSASGDFGPGLAFAEQKLIASGVDPSDELRVELADAMARLASVPASAQVADASGTVMGQSRMGCAQLRAAVSAIRTQAQLGAAICADRHQILVLTYPLLQSKQAFGAVVGGSLFYLQSDEPVLAGAYECSSADAAYFGGISYRVCENGPSQFRLYGAQAGFGFDIGFTQIRVH